MLTVFVDRWANYDEQKSSGAFEERVGSLVSGNFPVR
jgi:hypothetical protein